MLRLECKLLLGIFVLDSKSIAELPNEKESQGEGDKGGEVVRQLER